MPLPPCTPALGSHTAQVHKLKNAKSKQYEAARALPGRYRYGLSGVCTCAGLNAFPCA
jgi:hypothetical protein